jgi:hypothetical protein
MPKMSDFKDSFHSVRDSVSSGIGATQGDAYAGRVEAAIDKCQESLQNEAARLENVDPDILKGWLAEQWHAETFNVSAAAKGSNLSAQVPGDNQTGRDVVYGDPSQPTYAELKYSKSAERIATELNNPGYENSAKVVPSDQLDSVRDIARRRALYNQDHNRDKAAQYEDTAIRAQDHIEQNGISSKPLSEARAKEIADDSKQDGEIDPDKYGLQSEAFVEWSDVARQGGESALVAAALSAAISASTHIWPILKDAIDRGEIDPKLIQNLGNSVFESASSAGLRGGVAGCLTVACKTGLMGEFLNGVSPNAIGMATTMALNSIKYSIRMHQGTMSHQDFVHRSLRDASALTGGLYGAAVGQMIIPIPLLGALVGNLVGATLGATAYQGAHQVTLGLCVDSGWTLFGLVEQDYCVPEEVLLQAGYDLFPTKDFPLGDFPVGDFPVGDFPLGDFQTLSMNNELVQITPLRRGVVSCNVVAYM